MTDDQKNEDRAQENAITNPSLGDRSSLLKNDKHQQNSFLLFKDNANQRLSKLIKEEESFEKITDAVLKMSIIEEYAISNEHERKIKNRNYWLKVITVSVSIPIGVTFCFIGIEWGIIVLAIGLAAGLEMPEILELFGADFLTHKKNKKNKEEQEDA